MSDTNRVSFRIVEESTIGTTPSNPVFQNICHTGINSDPGIQTVQSEKVCGGSSRGIKDLPKVGEDPTAGYNFELEFLAQDKVLEGVFQSSWSGFYHGNSAAEDQIARDSTDPITGVDGTTYDFDHDDTGVTYEPYSLIKTRGFTNSANNGIFVVDTGSTATVTPVTATSLVAEASPPTTAQINLIGFQAASAADVQATTSGGNALTSTTTDFTTFNIAAGDWLKIGGNATANKFATAANNSWVRVSAVATNRIDLDVVPSGWATDTSSGVTLRVFTGDKINDGGTKKGFTVEQAFNDHSPVSYLYQRGVQWDSMSLSFQSRAIITGTVGGLGLSNSSTTTRESGASTIVEGANDSMNATSNVTRIAEGGSIVSGSNFITSMSVNIANNARRQNAIGSEASVGIGFGDFAVTGQVESYFDDNTILNKIINNTSTSLNSVVDDSEDQGYVFDMPSVKYSDGAPSVAGRNQDVTLPPNFTALEDATLGYTMKIQRFHAVTDA